MQSCVNGNIISVGDELVKRKYAQYEKLDLFHYYFIFNVNAIL